MAKKDELNFETDNKMASSEKLKALQAAMEKIEKSFGKGSIMKMGDDSVEQVEVIPTGSIALNVALGVGGYPEVESSKSMARNLPVKQHWLSMPLPKHKKPVVSLLLLMPNTPSTVSMQRNWELTLMISGFLNRTTESRHWKSPNNRSVLPLSISLLSTP